MKWKNEPEERWKTVTKFAWLPVELETKEVVWLEKYHEVLWLDSVGVWRITRRFQ